MNADLVEVLERIAIALENINHSVLELGWKDAIAPYGAIEGLGMEMMKGVERICDQIDSLSDKIEPKP